jgi:hypothetical protein
MSIRLRCKYHFDNAHIPLCAFIDTGQIPILDLHAEAKANLREENTLDYTMLTRILEIENPDVRMPSGIVSV